MRGNSTIDNVLVKLVGFSAISVAIFPLYFAFFFMETYRKNGASILAIWTIGESSLFWVGAYVAFGYLYLRQPDIRLPLQILAMIDGVVWAYSLVSYSRLLGSWNVRDGNFLAVSGWEMVALVLVGVLALIHASFRFVRRKR